MNSVNKAPHYVVQSGLINKRANATTKRLMDYLCSIHGEYILAGQQIGVLAQPELDVLKNTTGKYPAVYGFDFMNYTPSRVERGSTCKDTDVAIDWWKSGGIVTFCWHWNAPTGLVDIPPERSWDRGFYTEATTFDFGAAMRCTDSELFKLLIRDIDAIAVQLKRLQKEDVPVLWRPLHEASGGWFWWGAFGPEACINLWKYMYHRLTDYHGLNNLIWVWNGQHADWYPGDHYVDIIGEDIYASEHNYSSQLERYQQALSYTRARKLITLSENGVIPSIENMLQDEALWLWNCTWYGGFVCQKQDHSYIYSETHTDKEALLRFYSSPKTITKDRLPNLVT